MRKSVFISVLFIFSLLNSANADNIDWCEKLKHANWNNDSYGLPKPIIDIPSIELDITSKDSSGDISPAIPILKKMVIPNTIGGDLLYNLKQVGGDFYYFNHIKESDVYFFGSEGGSCHERQDIWAKNIKGVLQEINPPFDENSCMVDINFARIGNTKIILYQGYMYKNGSNQMDGIYYNDIKAVKTDPSTWSNVCEFNPSFHP